MRARRAWLRAAPPSSRAIPGLQSAIVAAECLSIRLFRSVRSPITRTSFACRCLPSSQDRLATRPGRRGSTEAPVRPPTRRHRGRCQRPRARPAAGGAARGTQRDGRARSGLGDRRVGETPFTRRRRRYRAQEQSDDARVVGERPRRRGRIRISTWRELSDDQREHQRRQNSNSNGGSATALADPTTTSYESNTRGVSQWRTHARAGHARVLALVSDLRPWRARRDNRVGEADRDRGEPHAQRHDPRRRAPGRVDALPYLATRALRDAQITRGRGARRHGGGRGATPRRRRHLQDVYQTRTALAQARFQLATSREPSARAPRSRPRWGFRRIRASRFPTISTCDSVRQSPRPSTH